MLLDKELYRQAQEYCRQWNEAKQVERAEMAARLSSQELWQRYLALIEFGLNISRHPSDWQRHKSWITSRSITNVCKKWKTEGAHVHEQLRLPLEKVIAFLESHGYRYAVSGGIALAQWDICALPMISTSKCSCPT